MILPAKRGTPGIGFFGRAPMMSPMAFQPSPAALYYTFRALRALSRELPEDFLLRVEGGLDEETLHSLDRGIRTIRTIGGLRGGAFYAFVAGSFLVIAGGFSMLWTGPIGRWAMLLGGVSWLISLGFLLSAFMVYLAARSDVRRVEAFVRATQRSSLSRDLA